MPHGKLPTLETERLILRALVPSDAPRIALLAGDKEIAATTLRIPHPYKEEDAVEFIGKVGKEILKGKAVVFAISEKTEGVLIGSMGLHPKKEDENAEMGYWIGKAYWGNGYCTEAGRKLLEYGFNDMKLRRIYAHHMGHNPASGRVLDKMGMTCEGCLREHVKKWDELVDVKIYGILKCEYDHQNAS